MRGEVPQFGTAVTDAAHPTPHPSASPTPSPQGEGLGAGEIYKTTVVKGVWGLGWNGGIQREGGRSLSGGNGRCWRIGVRPFPTLRGLFFPYSFGQAKEYGPRRGMFRWGRMRNGGCRRCRGASWRAGPRQQSPSHGDAVTAPFAQGGLWGGCGFGRRQKTLASPFGRGGIAEGDDGEGTAAGWL